MSRTNKKLIPPIILLVLQYLHIIAVGIVSGTVGLTADATAVLFFIWCGLVVLVYIPNAIYSFVKAKRQESALVLLFWNMTLKLAFIPIYITVFAISLLCSIAGPWAIAFWAVFFIFDYLLLLTTSMYGLAGIRRATRDGIMPKYSALIFGILHFVFCADVISAMIIYRRIKSNGYRRQTMPDASL